MMGYPHVRGDNAFMNNRRRVLLGGLAGAAALRLPPVLAANGLTRTIPAGGLNLPLIGLGTWLTFDAPPEDSRRRATCTEVMRGFFAAGGAMIDSSPMYGYSQDVIGTGLRSLQFPTGLFSATKVWIPGAELGRGQIEHAANIWGVERFDLVHVHNMLDWRTHLPWLSRWREQGRVRYIGITTSHGRRHPAMEEVIREQPFDFVQFTYNIADREAERRLLPLAQEYGKAVVINRPLRGGALFDQVRGRVLPDWAAEIDCGTWSQFFLKFVVSHPAVTCAIPATSRPDHLQENMAVLAGRLPDAAMREEMAEYFHAAS